MRFFNYLTIKINPTICFALNLCKNIYISNHPIKYIQNLLIQEKSFILIAR